MVDVVNVFKLCKVVEVLVFVYFIFDKRVLNLFVMINLFRKYKELVKYLFQLVDLILMPSIKILRPFSNLFDLFTLLLSSSNLLLNKWSLFLVKIYGKFSNRRDNIYSFVKIFFINNLFCPLKYLIFTYFFDPLLLLFEWFGLLIFSSK